MKPLAMRGLQSNLTLSYTFVTAIALLITEIIGFLAFQRWSPTTVFHSEPDIYTMQELADEAAVFLETESVDHDGLNTWLQDLSMPVLNLSDADDWLQANLRRFPQRDIQTLLVVDPEEGVIAATPEGNPYVDIRDLSDLPGRLDQEMFRQAPQQSGSNSVIFRHADASVMVIAITGDTGELLGLLVLITDLTGQAPSTVDMLMIVGGSLVLFTALAATIGTFFGFFTARQLTHRLYHLVEATSAWGRGDFAPHIEDSGADEIGELSRHLARLGNQLQELLTHRERWAATEERNRLARELHDSVKQEVFAIRMNLGSAQTIPDQAREFVGIAAGLAQQCQQELTGIIDVLRSDSAARPFIERLQDYLQSWTQRTGVSLRPQLPDTVSFAPEIEHHVFRITQEALANTDKHSQAVSAEFRLMSSEKGCRLIIRDDGIGFDVKQKHAGYGLQSIEDRVRTFGGKLRIDSSEAGTTLQIDIPEG